MALGIVKKVFGDYNEKELKKLWPLVSEVNEWESEIAALSDTNLRTKTDEFRQRLDEGKTLDDLLPEAFAVVRETSRRCTGLRHYDVQILGGIVLHLGKISEMKTGEGKTLMATLPMYLNALPGKGAHLVTVNDYLARRDAQWMGPIYRSLGLSVGVLQHDSAYVFDPTANLDNPSLRYLVPVSRRDAYAADITYGTNNEFGFDYLRDNMVTDISQIVQRPGDSHFYTIVDEVDNILIDEARTPLIISGPAEETEEVYRTFTRIVPRLRPGEDFIVDIKHRSVSLTDVGASHIEKALGISNLYDPANYRMTRFLDASLKASCLFQRDHHYVVKDGEVVIVDEFTGRLMPGRRWSDGLHQAMEAKEGVKIQRESVTYATITLQNYFRLYQKLAGMTGTAWTEREEFNTIYNLDVLIIPTHRDMVRDDQQDVIYRAEDGKYQAVVDEIEEMHAQGRPVLVGTVSIENSERLADMLKRLSTCRLETCSRRHKVCTLKKPEVLNAKHHEREAAIVSQAGRYAAVTIATNMAGRGTDIILGGNPEQMAEEIAHKRGLELVAVEPEVAEEIRQEAQQEWQTEHNEVAEAGGLHIIGTERHEARRIDNQLRGRAGRQGDNGSSRFFISFDDDVMRRFSPDWVPNLLARIGMDEDTPLESGMVGKAIEQAQTKVEGQNFDIRKHVVQYDDVMNAQRDLIYTDRRKTLEEASLKENITEMIDKEIESAFDAFASHEDPADWDQEALLTELGTIFTLPAHFTQAHLQTLQAEDAVKEGQRLALQSYEQKEQELSSEKMRTLERLVLLGTIDRLWVYHLTALEEMRQGIGLAGYGGRDPLVEFKREAHDMWAQLKDHIRQNVVRRIFHVTLTPLTAPQPQAQAPPRTQKGNSGAPALATSGATANGSDLAVDARASAASVHNKVGRNDPCPCSSGKKYKKCCGSGGVAV